MIGVRPATRFDETIQIIDRGQSRAWTAPWPWYVIRAALRADGRVSRGSASRPRLDFKGWQATEKVT
jgi:hypothetical protein